MRCGRIQSLPQEKLTAQDEKMMSERQWYTLFGKNWEGIQFLFRSVQLPYLCKALPRLNGVAIPVSDKKMMRAAPIRL